MKIKKHSYIYLTIALMIMTVGFTGVRGLAEESSVTPTGEKSTVKKPVRKGIIEASQEKKQKPELAPVQKKKVDQDAGIEKKETEEKKKLTSSEDAKKKIDETDQPAETKKKENISPEQERIDKEKNSVPENEKDTQPLRDEKAQQEKKDDGKKAITEKEDKKEEIHKEEKKERIDTSEKAEGKKKQFSALSKTEYVGLFAGYGGFFPVEAYSNRFRPAQAFSFTASCYYIDLFGISPEVNARYADMKSISDPFKYSAELTLLQIYPSLVWRYKIPLKAQKTTIIPYVRIWDGLSVVTYKSTDSFIPVMKVTITENLNSMGLSAGCNVEVYRGITVGIDIGYGVIFTTGTLLQSMNIALVAGYRI